MHRQLRNLTGAAAMLLSLAAVSANAHPHYGHGHRVYHHPPPPHVVAYHPGWSVCFGKHGRRHRRSGPFHRLDLCVGNAYRTYWVVGHGHRRPHWRGHRPGPGCRHW